MNIIPTTLPGVTIFEPKVHGDRRGFFMETWQRDRYAAAGVPMLFAQDNVSSSVHGVLRGLHYQDPHPQGKLVYVIQGEVFDVAVDVRYGSPTFGQWVGVTLSSENHRQLYVPEGFAHGFCVTSETCIFAYKCTDTYHRESEVGIRWDDPQIGIQWPVENPIVSDKDRGNAFLSDIPIWRLPRLHTSIAA
jgi:dTDP-4-dehydrorhamnose 3,5-epimerase